MTGSLASLVASYADRVGAELPPGWQAAQSGDSEGASFDDLFDFCRQLGWPMPEAVKGRPRANQFPLFTFHDSEGWALAQARDSLDRVRVQGRSGLDSREVSDGTVFYRLALPASSEQHESPAPLAVFWRSLHRRKEVFFSAIVATVIVNLVALATSLYSMQVYDRVIPRSGFATLWVLTAGIIFALLIDFALRTTRALMIEREAAKIDSEVSEFFFARAQAIRLDARPAGIGTMAGQLRGWEQVRALLSSGFIFLVADLPFALFFILVIGWLGGEIALVPLVSFPLALILAAIFARLIRADTEKAQMSGNRKNGLLVESLDAAETIKANRGSWFMLARWTKVLDEIQLHEDPVKRWSSIATSVFSAMQQIAYVMVVAWGALRVVQGEMTMGALIACTILAGRVNGPLVAQLPNFLVQWGYARSSLKALQELMKLPLDQTPGVDLLRPERVEPSIKLENVGFAYPGTRSGIEIPSLDIRKGERVALIGSVGSGKSTLLKVMAGLFAPMSGSVTVGGLDMAQVSPNVLRRHLGYVPQETRMLNGSLRDNILLGLHDASDDAIMAVVEELGLTPLISGHPRGLDLPISEGGRGLSGGQRTLAQLVRLFLTDPDLWLLDEPTANLDEAAEGRVLEGLKRRLTPERTLVLVTHRMRLLPLSDRVIVLQNGRIVLDGATAKVVAALKGSSDGRLAETDPQKQSVA